MYEFSKLTPIDLSVASWLFEKCPNRLYAYLEYLAEEDYPRRGIKLDAKLIFRELIEVYSLPMLLAFNFFTTDMKIVESNFFRKVNLLQSPSFHALHQKTKTLL